MGRILQSGETLFAIAVAAVGVIVVTIGAGYPIGDLAEPGPGVFPAALGLLLTVLGLGIAISGADQPAASARLPLRPLVFVGGAILVWAAVVEQLGFVPATVALVGISAFAERRIRPVAIASLAIVLSVGGIAAFIYGFRMPFEAFRW